MKNTHIILLFLFISLVSFNSIANATVGGPTYIHSVQTDSQGKEVIYQTEDLGGRGCPPEIFSINIQTGAKNVLIDCDDTENFDAITNMAKLEETLAKFPIILNRIDLLKNGISAVSKVVAEEKYDESKGNFGKTDFSVDILQDGTKKETFTYSGCTPGQPQVIEGYDIPNSTSIALVLSTKGDCFEGGYSMDRIFIVPNVKKTDTTPLSTKSDGDVTAKEGDLSFTATNNSSSEPTILEAIPMPTTTITERSPLNGYHIAIGLLVLVILGLLGRKKK